MSQIPPKIASSAFMDGLLVNAVKLYNVYSSTINGIIDFLNSVLGTWQDYAATLQTSSNPQPSLGTGGTIVTRYSLINNVLNYRGKITWGTAGIGVGNGVYELDIPLGQTMPLETDNFQVGTCVGTIGGVQYIGFVFQLHSSLLKFSLIRNDLRISWTNAAPAPPQAGDFLYFAITAEVV